MTRTITITSMFIVAMLATLMMLFATNFNSMSWTPPHHWKAPTGGAQEAGGKPTPPHHW